MKTLFKISSVLVLLSMVVLPSLVFAVDQPANCCRAVKDIDLKGMGIYVGGASLDKLSSGETIGGESICILTNAAPTKQSDQWGVVCLMNTIYNVTNWIFVILMAIVVIMVIIGGFYFVTAAGDEGRIKTGRTMITYAVIGIIVALLARFIPALIRAIL